MKLTVCCITYNQESYVAQTMEGIAMQQTSFGFNTVIHDDASTDDTASIIRGFEGRVPGMQLTVHEKNKGSLRNCLESMESCTSEYVALCEGDDYWTDSSKLQMQVDWLDAHPEYAICWTKGSLLKQRTGEMEPYPSPVGPCTWEKLSESNPFLTATAVFRREALLPIPGWFYDMPYGDWTVYLHVLHQSGKMGYCLPDITTVYRLHAGGIHGGLQQTPATLAAIYQKDLRFFEAIRMHHQGHSYAMLESGISLRHQLLSNLQQQARPKQNMPKWYSRFRNRIGAMLSSVIS